ncbi:TIGR03905 family TSCPD domain-containing protein [[Clostridium] spiroforme]|nr:TIGR03905 family TSCPD domain-containing protein [Thomasclavelia spiroformis]MBM6880939.1 TIGR03905 family TSCPD domain-containing protein [Thomasclavelia spiroformis]MBM6931225.1 TIGR03905 family TSCPD domain-containing protein [Thomasclavelia spiroformis]
MEINFTPRGVCSKKIHVEVEDGIIQNVIFYGGCHGNTQGVAALAKGMKVEDVIARLKDIRCGMKPTSCPAQLAKCLEECSQ